MIQINPILTVAFWFPKWYPYMYIFQVSTSILYLLIQYTQVNLRTSIDV